MWDKKINITNWQNSHLNGTAMLIYTENNFFYFYVIKVVVKIS
jgi:hypothetical protein